MFTEFREPYPPIEVCSLKSLSFGLKGAVPAQWTGLIRESPDASMCNEARDDSKLCFGQSDIAVESIKIDILTSLLLHVFPPLKSG